MINQSPIRKVDYGHDIESIEEAIDTFVAATDAPDDVSEQFADVVKGMADTIGELQSENDQLQSENDELDEENDELHEEVDRLEKELADQREESAKDRANIKQRLTEVEDTTSEDESAGVQPDRTTRHNYDTPLETVVSLDEDTAEKELTANQSRARFICKDPLDYSVSVPKGRSITSSDISKILKSGTDCQGRTATTARVMEFIADLGGDEVELVKRRGTRRVVFSEEIAERLDELGETDNAVVMGGPQASVI
jgi:regulator of replication initiation timing